MATGNSSDRRKKNGSGWGVVVIVAVMLLSNLSEQIGAFFKRAGSFTLPRLDLPSAERFAIPLALLLAAAVIAIAVVKTVRTRQMESDAVGSYSSKSRAPTAQDKSGFDAANSSYSHDRARRQAQLDSFLKNGIIDKAEYLVLIDRYRKEESQL